MLTVILLIAGFLQVLNTVKKIFTKQSLHLLAFPHRSENTVMYEVMLEGLLNLTPKERCTFVTDLPKNKT